MDRVEHATDPVKGSRFIGLAAPVGDEGEALALVAEARARWPDASHHCWAYRLADGRSRSSDDGEPGSSAGRPILARIEGKELHAVAVVVTRWFGGTKLGVGGLIRAYGGCAGETLDRGPVAQRIPRVTLQFVHDYSDTAAIQAVLGPRGLQATATYGEAVAAQVEVDEDQADSLCEELRGATQGRVQAQPLLAAVSAADPEVPDQGR